MNFIKVVKMNNKDKIKKAFNKLDTTPKAERDEHLSKLVEILKKNKINIKGK